MNYSFSVSSYEAPALEKEIALALDARSALSMRKRGAKPTPPKAVKEASAVSRKWRKIAGITVMVLGGALLLCVTSMVQRSKLLQILGFLLLGVGLMVMRSGAPAGEAHASQKSLQKAQRLLAALRQNNFVNGLNVRFDDEKMTIATKSKNVDVPYPELHSVVETEHMWFVTYGQAGVVLHKRDLTEGAPEAFLSDIAAASGCSTERIAWTEEITEENADEAPSGAASETETTGEAL